MKRFLEYKIYRTNIPSQVAAMQNLLSQVASVALTPVRLLFFCGAKTNEEFQLQRQTVEYVCREHYTKNQPVVALIAQAPIESTYAVEVTYAAPQCVDIAYHNNHIILNNNLLLSGAIYSSTNISITEQSNQIFSELGDILARENYQINNIVRQWNYIENITLLSPEGQNYQQFNDARSEFYSKTTWKNGYPAATGIGTACGGVTVVVDALRNSDICSEPIDNPLQISAHAYSQKVLINNISAPNKTTPKFERARRVECKEMEAIYISGTAAIRGEESCTDSDIISQIELTMENIEQLTSQKDSKHKNDSQEAGYENSMLRIYLKHRSNWPQVKQWIADNCANIETLCIEADICRSELLVEIEGIANKIIQNR